MNKENGKIGIDKEIENQIELARKIANEAVKSDIKGIQQRIGEIMQVRGTIIEMAIGIEDVLDKIINLYKPTFLPYNLTFQNKVETIKKIIKELSLSMPFLEKEFMSNLNKIVQKRNIYAHSPQDYGIKELNIYDKKSDKLIKIREDIKETMSLFDSTKKLLDKIYPLIASIIKKRDGKG